MFANCPPTNGRLSEILAGSGRRPSGLTAQETCHFGNESGRPGGGAPLGPGSTGEHGWDQRHPSESFCGYNATKEVTNGFNAVKGKGKASQPVSSTRELARLTSRRRRPGVLLAESPRVALSRPVLLA